MQQCSYVFKNFQFSGFVNLVSLSFLNDAYQQNPIVRYQYIFMVTIGQSHFLKAEMIKEGAVVIDVGISRTPDGLQGDVCPGVFEKASYVAPMPGGVGPMTRAMLLTNVVDACER